MNWTRGFFRTWVVISGMWVTGVTVDALTPESLPRTKLTVFRANYPAYDDMSDAELASALHANFYSDMPRVEFDAKIGLIPPQVPRPPPGFTLEDKASSPAHPDPYAAFSMPVVTEAPSARTLEMTLEQKRAIALAKARARAAQSQAVGTPETAHELFAQAVMGADPARLRWCLRMALVPPAALFAFGLMLVWIARGFQRDQT
jgi:hypothetical protein